MSADAKPARQLPLPFEPQARSTFESFIAGPNDELVSRLRQRDIGFECLWLFGESGVGKTHLLQAMCRRLAHACYIPATGVDPRGNALEAYRRFDVVTVDDVGHWLGERQAELACFDLYNQLHAAGARLVLTADRSPRATNFALADLGSRLRAAACYRVAALADEDKRQLLADAAQQRGLRLGDEVVRYLLARASRGQHELMAMLDSLDRSSLAQQRHLTIPFVKRVLRL